MPWSTKDFLTILETPLAQELLSDTEITEYAAHWKDEHKAALLHANGITKQTPIKRAKPMLQLVAAFARKDLHRLDELLNNAQVSTGVRLDYLLPLYDERNGAGEDIFIASTKVMLRGNERDDVRLQAGNMMHSVGNLVGNPYTKEELQQLEAYVNNSFIIRKLLKNAPNKEIVHPTKKAIEYIIHNAANYRDTNNNPVMVFIPGALSIQNYPISQMIEDAVKCGANINDVGFFGVPGIVWAIILGNIESVHKFLAMGAKVDIVDEMGNQNVIAWACSTYAAMENDKAYSDRLMTIIKDLRTSSTNQPNHLKKKPFDYLDFQTKAKLYLLTPRFTTFQSSANDNNRPALNSNFTNSSLRKSM